MKSLLQWRRWRRRERDRRLLWPVAKFQMQDRDHAIAWMSLHMLMHEHWYPEGFLDSPAPFYDILERAMHETQAWGPAGRHLYNVPVDAEHIDGAA